MEERGYNLGEDAFLTEVDSFNEPEALPQYVGTNGVSQNHLLSFDDNKVLKIINWIC